MALPSPKITLLPALDADYLALSTLECSVFYTEEFSTVAFGPHRDSPTNIALRASSMAKVPSNPNRRNRYTKAILKLSSGEEEIVGFAGWSFITKREEEMREKTEELSRREKSAEERLEENEQIWGPGANFRFCEDVFGVADEHMLRSCEGKDYCKLSTLAVSPKYQRIRIGTKLLEDGLNEADNLGLQAILGASPEGEGLYQRYGFREFVVMNLKLWEYEGGEGMSLARHTVMHRPAQSTVTV